MRLRWTKAARRDRELIYAYVEADNAQAALELDNRFDDRSTQLVQLPNLGRAGRVSGTRELTIAGSSYVMVYRLDGDVLWIVRVIHTSRVWPEKPT